MRFSQTISQYNKPSSLTVRSFTQQICQRYRAHKLIVELKKHLSDDEFLDDIGVSRTQVLEQIDQLKKRPVMSNQTDISNVAALLGDPKRFKIMMALMGGKALTATELAVEADISASTASSHLNKLLGSHLIQVQKQGRHKYFRLQDFQVAELIESLFNISARIEHSTVSTGPNDPDLRKARICYDHLAGELGVELLFGLKSQEFVYEESGQIRLSENGKDFFKDRRADITAMQKLKRPMCRNCLDWSERKFHLAGSLGKWILNDIHSNEWGRKDLDSRVIRFSSNGLKAFKRAYGVSTI